jgi:hypothetical protein
MAKTKETIALETALIHACAQQGHYGCPEVTIGFPSQGRGDEIVDFMSVDEEGRFRCYELKVTLADLKSSSKLSWYGDFNYLVVSRSLEQKVADWDLYIPAWVGIYAGEELALKRRPRRMQVTADMRKTLTISLLRTLYYKMETWRRAGDMHTLRALEKEIEELQKTSAAQAAGKERQLWTAQDYERWYRRNHQDPSFSLEEGAKKQRQEASARQQGKMTWIPRGNMLECPVCHCLRQEASAYCPGCGSDLRKIESSCPKS